MGADRKSRVRSCLARRPLTHGVPASSKLFPGTIGIMISRPPRTMFEKIWDRHAITTNEAGQTLLFIDRHYCHELSFHAFNMLHGNDRTVRRPDRTFAIPDHYTPTTGLSSGSSCSRGR